MRSRACSRSDARTLAQAGSPSSSTSSCGVPCGFTRRSKKSTSNASRGARMRYLIEHESVLRFPNPIREHRSSCALAPREDAGALRLSVRGGGEPAHRCARISIATGNLVHRASLLAPTIRCCARVTAEVETALANPFDYCRFPPLRAALARAHRRDDPSLLDFVLHRSDAVPDLDGALADSLRPRPSIPAATAPERARADGMAGATFRYPRLDRGPRRARQSPSIAPGSVRTCHLVVAGGRSWDSPALRDGVRGSRQRSRRSGERQATHALRDVLIPGAGLARLRRHRGLITNDTYVPVAVGATSATPAAARTFRRRRRHPPESRCASNASSQQRERTATGHVP